MRSLLTAARTQLDGDRSFGALAFAVLPILSVIIFVEWLP